jgi:hypothetical protein
MTDRLAAVLVGARIVVPTMLVHVSPPVAVGSTLSIPIMREGFVTETGLLPPSAAPPAPDTGPGPAAPEQLGLWEESWPATAGRATEARPAGWMDASWLPSLASGAGSAD